MTEGPLYSKEDEHCGEQQVEVVLEVGVAVAETAVRTVGHMHSDYTHEATPMVQMGEEVGNLPRY